MSNKFLGINSINVLKKYIDEQIVIAEENTRVITLHAYAYYKNGVKPKAPTEGGGFDPEGANIVYPIGWGPLNTVIQSLVKHDNTKYEDIETALSEGSIWMTVGVAEGATGFGSDTWSTPIKISGQNGVSVRFKYAYDPSTPEAERSDNPKGVSSSNPHEYVWTKYGDDDWVGPSLWAVYATNANVIIYKYRTTTSIPNNMPAPTSNIDPDWNDSAGNLSQDKPYLWMSWKYVPAYNPNDPDDEPSNDGVWSNPLLIGHYGLDGKDGKDGLDGNVPDYSITLYALSDSVDETKPEFVCELEDPDNPDYRLKLEDLLTTNKVDEEDGVWHKVPPTMDDTQIMWYVIINVSGGDNKNIESINTVDACSEVMRFSAIDGDVKTSVFTKYLYYWSNKQVLPENITDEDWVEIPEYNAEDLDGSLWMRMGVCRLDTSTGEITMVNTEKPWSDPVKLSGPRGPIAYDYRVESRYGIGTADQAPSNWKQMSEINPTQTYPYIWEKRYLSLYRMKYADTANADGTYDVVEDAFIKTIGDPEVFRLSGLNGATGADGKNGNRLNTIAYTTVDENRTISNFDDINYFISNSTEDTHYTLHGDKFGDFVSGYTGKFANIGTGNMIITTEESTLTGIDIDDSSQMILYPGETVEIVTYNDNGECLFISLGKNSKSTSVEEPVEPEPIG